METPDNPVTGRRDLSLAAVLAATVRVLRSSARPLPKPPPDACDDGLTARSLAAVALKVWGAMLIVGALAALPAATLFATLAPPTDAEASAFRATQIGSMLTLLFQGLFGILLVAFVDRIVRWVIPDGRALRIVVAARRGLGRTCV